MIFAYDPFVGFFSGTLYDTVIEPAGLYSYRLGSAASLIAALSIAVHLRREEDGLLRLAWPGRPWIAAVGAIALVVSLAVTASGPRLGHWTTAASIAETLGARVSGARCDVIHARALRVAEMKRLADDCDAHVAAAERWFGAPGPLRITAFVFESAAQKGALMGAADTFIAKPWRREVYIQNAAYPHPVIGHELVHAVSSAYARGPFRVAGSVGGLLPNPGLIEGVAVAAEPREGDLLPREWAKAMKDLKLLPPLGNLFALGFLGENAGVAYTVSGAFVGWVHDRFGAEVIRGWYGGRDLADLTRLSWPALEKAWHEDLDGAVLPEAARAVAKARFDRPAIFGRRCPHAIDACKGRADRLRGAGDYEGALAAYDEVLAMDPRDGMARVNIALTRIRQGRVDEGAAALDAIAANQDVPRHVRDRALDERADLALGLDRGEEAVKLYRELMSRTVDDDALRNFEVKIAAAEDPRLRPALVALLVGIPARGTDRTLALELLGALTAKVPEEGLPHYLLARQFFNAGQYEDAIPRLDRALAGALRIARVRVESERLRLVSACALGDRRLAAEAFGRYAAYREISEARRDAARSLVERCTGSPAPPVPGYDGRGPSGGSPRP
jgi:tetratricopeptide (TPR) repeat protein